MNQKKVAAMLKKHRKCHEIWHKFYNYLVRKYGTDLHGEWQYMDIKGKKMRYRSFKDLEFSQKLVGYEVMQAIERWIKRYCPQIKIIHCDDAVYAGSIILLIPHPKHGITIMYIPQCTSIQNQFFLYSSHYKQLIKELTKMKKIYDKDI